MTSSFLLFTISTDEIKLTFIAASINVKFHGESWNTFTDEVSDWTH